MRGMLATAGLLSLAVATVLLIAQRDLKRLLAYSRVEHLGVLALAAAIGGPLAISAALLHVLGHGLAKSSAFVASGWILETEGTTRLEDLRLLLRRRPGVAVPFLVGVTALLGLPPFSLFFSEVAIVVAGVQRGMTWVMAATVVLLLGAFAALARRVAVIAFGSPDATAEDTSAPDWSAPGPRFPLGVALGATAVAGFVAGPFAGVLTDAARVLGGAG
jgi:hydrogenase-4 component F